jgi:hypothetical protein
MLENCMIAIFEELRLSKSEILLIPILNIIDIILLRNSLKWRINIIISIYHAPSSRKLLVLIDRYTVSILCSQIFEDEMEQDKMSILMIF